MKCKEKILKNINLKIVHKIINLYGPNKISIKVVKI